MTQWITTGANQGETGLHASSVAVELANSNYLGSLANLPVIVWLPLSCIGVTLHLTANESLFLVNTWFRRYSCTSGTTVDATPPMCRVHQAVLTVFKATLVFTLLSASYFHLCATKHSDIGSFCQELQPWLYFMFSPRTTWFSMVYSVTALLKWLDLASYHANVRKYFCSTLFRCLSPQMLNSSHSVDKSIIFKCFSPAPSCAHMLW